MTNYPGALPSTSVAPKQLPVRKRKMSAATFILYIVLGMVAAVYIFPLLFLVNISIKDPLKYLMDPVGIAKQIDLMNYVNAWVQGSFSEYVANSFLYSIVPTVVSLLVTLLIAFPLARGYVRGVNKWYVFFMMSLFLPNGQIPLFQLMLHLHLYNSQLGYMLLKVTGVGIGLLILTGYIRSIPKELDEAAAMDGCGYFRYIFSVVLPLVQPALATVAIFSCIGTWNDIIGPTIFLADSNKWPIVLGLYHFYGEYGNQWTVLSAAIVIVAAPLVVLYVLLQRYIVEGAVAGSLKS